jgi:hypothetical protein
MPVRKYVNKAFRKGKRYAKKRYSTRTGGVRVNQLARDIYKIKRSLNVEHKHFDFKFGSGQSVSAFQPVNNDPIFEGVPLPTRGTSYNQRIGNQIRITNITLKLIMDFQNNQDLISRTTASVRLLFAKSGEDNPTIDELYDLDANGHYTRNSFVNTQNWKKYTWIKSLNSFKSHSDKVNRYDQSNSTASAYPENNSGGNQTIDVDDPATTSLNLSKYYINKQTKCSIPVKFESGTDSVITQYKPFLLFMSDVVTSGSNSYDPVSISGQVRFTYVDN